MNRQKWMLWIFIIILLAMLSGMLLGLWYVQSRLNLISRPAVVEREPTPEEVEAILKPSEPVIETEDTIPEKTGEVINILLIGQDSREGEEAKLADTILLCTLNCDERKLTVTSFLRDLYVQLPNYRGYVSGKNRINVNYALGFAKAGDLGGMEMTAQCIEENFGVAVDGVVVVGFDAFVQLVDAIGGITVDLDEAEAEYLNKRTENQFEAGSNRIYSWDVLTYVRMRHSGPGDSDFHRTSRQRKAMESLIEQCKQIRPAELGGLLQTVLPMVTTNLTNEQIILYGIKLLPILNQLKYESEQCPAEGTYRGEIIEIMGVPSGVLIPDLQTNRDRLMALTKPAV